MVRVISKSKSPIDIHSDEFKTLLKDIKAVAGRRRMILQLKKCGIY